MDPLDASKHSKFQIRFPEIALLMPNLVRASTLLYNRLRTLFLAEPFWQLLVAQKLEQSQGSEGEIDQPPIF